MTPPSQPPSRPSVAVSGGRLLVAGTTSDAGKTVVTTALCRVFARRGLRVAPFKAQNMSNNSMVTRDGAEIGRAQWVQAVAAGAEPEAAMNPVLLKPGSDRRSHVVVMGRPAGTLEAADFLTGRASLAEAAFAAYDDLAARHDLVVCEGAGSPAEVNLRARDFVNMGLAQHARMPTLVVGDIDRGGVFASMLGTLALLDAADQSLVVAWVVNRFRGDVSLLAPALATLEERTGRPVAGVLPWLRGAWLDSEDALVVEDPHGRGRDEEVHGPRGPGRLRVAVVRLPRISNFTDVDALRLEPHVEVRFASAPDDLADADVVVLPGTRATLADLRWLRRSGLADEVVRLAGRGAEVLGICGGFQMLGRQVQDPYGVEGEAGDREDGLGLLEVSTLLEREKVVRLVEGHALGSPVHGYEIHHGRVDVAAGEVFLDGVRTGSVSGTLWHGAWESDSFREAWLRGVAERRGHDDFVPGGVRFAQAREDRIDLLADAAERHLDVELLLDRALSGAPAGLPTLVTSLG